jgi:two-component system, OmpR family, response regulator
MMKCAFLSSKTNPISGGSSRSTLEGAGYAVDLATDGEDGHYLGSTETYDAVVLDLGLPEIDGLTVLDRWRKEGKKMPVLVLTARDSWSDKVAGWMPAPTIISPSHSRPKS